MLERCELWFEGLDVLVVAGEVVALDVSEVVEDAGGGRRAAAATGNTKCLLNPGRFTHSVFSFQSIRTTRLRIVPAAPVAANALLVAPLGDVGLRVLDDPLAGIPAALELLDVVELLLRDDLDLRLAHAPKLTSA